MKSDAPLTSRRFAVTATRSKAAETPKHMGDYKTRDHRVRCFPNRKLMSAHVPDEVRHANERATEKHESPFPHLEHVERRFHKIAEAGQDKEHASAEEADEEEPEGQIEH